MDNEYKSGQEGAPSIFRVLKAAGTTGGEKVYVGNPVRVLNEEAEGIDLQYDYDSSITVPFTLLSSAGLATGDLMIGLPIAGRPAALGGSGAQVAGIVTGCGLFPAVKAVVEIQPAGGGTPYATLTADDHGHYSGTVPIPVSGTYRFVTKPHATDEPYAARFATGTVDRTLTLGAVNNIPITFLTPAAGFHCTPLVYYPVGNLVVTDPYYNRTYICSWEDLGSVQRWRGTRAGLSYPGCGPCGAVNHATLGGDSFYLFSSITTYQFIHIYTDDNTANRCPTFIFSGSSGFIDVAQINMTVTSQSPLEATASIPAGNSSRWYCGAAVTFTMREQNP
jgi:hypothetical protein